MTTWVRSPHESDEDDGIGIVCAVAVAAGPSLLLWAGIVAAWVWLGPAKLAALVVLMLALVGLVVALAYVELALNRRRPGASLHAPSACSTLLRAGGRRLHAVGRTNL